MSCRQSIKKEFTSLSIKLDFVVDVPYETGFSLLNLDFFNCFFNLTSLKKQIIQDYKTRVSEDDSFLKSKNLFFEICNVICHTSCKNLFSS